MPFLFVVAVLELARNGQSGAPAPAGTIGLSTVQMYSDGQPEKRGPLVVVEVWGDSAATSSGICNADLILAIDGVSVMGKDPDKAFPGAVDGPIGGTVRLTLVRPSDHLRSFEAVLTRSAYPLRRNPSVEPFAYSVRRSWRVESYPFPLPWAPKLPFTGIEDVLFAPRFDDRTSSDYHSLVYVWWVEGTSVITPRAIQTALLEYFRGLSKQRGDNYHFTPDLSKVSTTEMKALTGTPGTPGTAGTAGYRDDVVTYNPQGELITLHVDVEQRPCSQFGHTALLFVLSPAPPETPIWNDLQSIRATFRCARG